MNRQEELEYFFSYLKDLSYQNPDTYITKNDIYGLLRTYDTDQENVSYKELFPYWIENFKGSNINCFHSMMQSRFLQFHNDPVYDAQYIKMYVSVKPEAMYETVNQIFKFSSINDIKMLSKVADVDRSDEIVLRIEKEEDAAKLINFINSNEYITSNARLTNPFVQRAGIVGLAYDDMLSYNSTIALFVEDYLKTKKENNTLDTISLSDFQEYIVIQNENIFQNFSSLNDFMQNPEVRQNIARFEYNGSSLDYAIEDYANVAGLIIQSCKGSDDIGHFIEGFRHTKDEGASYEYRSSVYRALNREDQMIDYKEILDSYIRYAKEKYGSDKLVALYLSDYAAGNQRAITRDNGFRTTFVNNISQDIIKELTQDNVFGYVSSLGGDQR